MVMVMGVHQSMMEASNKVAEGNVQMPVTNSEQTLTLE
jgi:hypothetical protein